MITEELMEKMIKPSFERRRAMQEIPGQSFNKCFKEVKWIQKFKKNHAGQDLKELFSNLDKREVIIFSPNYQKINELEEIKSKVIFPFDNVFLEYPLQFNIIDKKREDVISIISDGFYFKAFKNKEGETNGIMVFSILLDYGSNPNNIFEEGVKPFICMLPYDQLNKEISFTEEVTNTDKIIIQEVMKVFKKVCYLVQRKEYNEYFKWTPQEIIKKEIIYSHDVKSHKRHFWKDSGKFKIPLLSKEELSQRGYGLDECVFRGYELRRDVPYKIINSYVVGKDKPKKIEHNKIINLLKKRQFKNEQKLGLTLSNIFPDKFIKKHDRKTIRPLELDFYIHDLKLAFEYDGEQHFDKNICENVFKTNFESQKNRDNKKNSICRHKNINLIRVKYDEPLTITNIKNKIKLKGIIL